MAGGRKARMRSTSLTLLVLVCGCGGATTTLPAPSTASSSSQNAGPEPAPGMIYVEGTGDGPSIVRERLPSDGPDALVVDLVATGDLDGDGRADAVVSYASPNHRDDVSLEIFLRRSDGLADTASAGETTMDADRRMRVTELRIADGRLVRRTQTCAAVADCPCVPDSRCCDEYESVSRWNGTELEEVAELARTIHEVEAECR